MQDNAEWVLGLFPSESYRALYSNVYVRVDALGRWLKLSPLFEAWILEDEH